jgi:hypothetical protein
LKPEQKDTEVELVCLEILKEVLARFGLALAPSVHDEMLPAITRVCQQSCSVDDDDVQCDAFLLLDVVQRLEHSSDTVRKRAIATLGALVLVLADRSFNALMEQIIARY